MYTLASKLLLFAVATCVLIFGALVVFVAVRHTNDAVPMASTLAEIAPLPSSPLDATYLVAQSEVSLTGGEADRSGNFGQSDSTRTSVVGEPVYGDVNDDGMEDAVLILHQDTGGSGTFVYIALALFNGTGYLGLNSVFLGDRIVVQSIVVENTLIRAVIRERGPDDPQASVPTVQKEKYFTVSGSSLVEVVREGDELFLSGFLTLDADQEIFTTCASTSYSMNRDARAWGAIRAVHGERSAQQNSGAVFMMLVGSIATGMDDEEQVFSPRLLVAAPKLGVCGAPSNTVGTTTYAEEVVGERTEEPPDATE